MTYLDRNAQSLNTGLLAHEEVAACGDAEDDKTGLPQLISAVSLQDSNQL